MTLPFTMPRAAWIALGALAAIIALLVMLNAYGNSREREGVRKTDAKWEQASAELKKEAAMSATRADDLAVKRLEKHVAEAKAEEAEVEKAKADGSSPLDVLFGG